MSNKNDIIKSVNEIKKTNIADLKKDLVGNSSGKNFNALATYNAMLDHITIGPGTNTTINVAGFDWTLRLLGSQEFIQIRKDAINQCKKDELFDDWYQYYLIAIATIGKALTPNPFKPEGEAIFTIEDLKLVNYDVLIEIYKRYIHFVDMATKKAEEFKPEELEALIQLVEKKPELLSEFNRKQFLILTPYLFNLSQEQAKIIKKEQTS